MIKPEDRVVKPGDVFGRWTVVRFSHQVGAKPFWCCRCECGAEKPVYQASLRNGRSKSCGCLRQDVQTERQTKHGGRLTPEYRSWQGMIARCGNPKLRSYADYGGRGIKVCDRWRESFAAFLEDMGQKPSDAHSVDRIDSNRGYEPGNCRWATDHEQSRNKRNNHVVTHGGESLTLADWSERTGILFNTLRSRIEGGWDTKDAIETPASQRNGKRYRDPTRKAITLTMNGETMTVMEWSRRVGIQPATLIVRHRQGWSDEKVLTEPIRQWPGREKA